MGGEAGEGLEVEYFESWPPGMIAEWTLCRLL
jgi:hypothetical protein